MDGPFRFGGRAISIRGTGHFDSWDGPFRFIGWAISISVGTYARIAPRPGFALKNTIQVGAGVVDADYRGEVGAVIFNHSAEDFEIKVGDRIVHICKSVVPSFEIQCLLSQRPTGGHLRWFVGG